MTAAEHAVRETVRAWLDAVKALDFEAARGLWDAQFDGLLYQPEEHELPMTDWDTILRYWDKVPALVESVPEWDEISSMMAVVDRVALVFSRLRTSIKIRDVDKTFDGEVRCSFGLHRTDNSWLLVHYHESRLVAVEDVISELTR
ncbi:nuclear transport factor 2 family protein [Pseudonocardia acidicola]|uniref:Nuclear transport factor 2 family protein n=1 Tax=Pseudonocardia acidicola TaxID=2724939 RepID=A0ABX1SJV7_9PSEU|nr:nuclear transport factor 2 family protein [Pseudonocardia acidicola]NMI01861.1 nuclear transport factor 2 family protein [Pseudonocardia acidicola]